MTQQGGSIRISGATTRKCANEVITKEWIGLNVTKTTSIEVMDQVSNILQILKKLRERKKNGNINNEGRQLIQTVIDDIIISLESKVDLSVVFDSLKTKIESISESECKKTILRRMTFDERRRRDALDATRGFFERMTHSITSFIKKAKCPELPGFAGDNGTRIIDKDAIDIYISGKDVSEQSALRASYAKQVNEFKEEMKEGFHHTLVPLKGGLIFFLILISLVYQVTFIAEGGATKDRNETLLTISPGKPFLSAFVVGSCGVLSFLFLTKSRLAEVSYKNMIAVFTILAIFDIAQEASGLNRYLSESDTAKGEGIYYAMLSDADKANLAAVNAAETTGGDPFLKSMSYVVIILFALFTIYSIFKMFRLVKCSAKYYSPNNGETCFFFGKIKHKWTAFILELLVVCSINVIPVIVTPFIRGEKFKIYLSTVGMIFTIFILQLMFHYVGFLPNTTNIGKCNIIEGAPTIISTTPSQPATNPDDTSAQPENAALLVQTTQDQPVAQQTDNVTLSVLDRTDQDIDAPVELPSANSQPTVQPNTETQTVTQSDNNALSVSSTIVSQPAQTTQEQPVVPPTSIDTSSDIGMTQSVTQPLTQSTD